MAISPAQVADWLRLPESAADDDPTLAECVAATNAWAARIPYVADQMPADGDTGEPAPWPEDVTTGAIMLAARLYRRRNTPGGIEAGTDGGAVYVPRRDADVSTLLHLGAPEVG